MLALAHHYDELLTSRAGSYRARVYGQPQKDGLWAGWIVFFPMGGGQAIATDRETTQSSLADLSYWASGLTHLYLHGALDRALALQPAAELARELAHLDRIEARATARAEALEEEASVARAEAELAETVLERTEEELFETLGNEARKDAAAHEHAATKSRAAAREADRALRARKRRKSSPTHK
jgi:hypothetical protein